MNFSCRVSESPAIFPFIFIAVFAPYTKNFRPVILTLTPLLPSLILHLSEMRPSSVLPSTLKFFLQAAVSARISTFDMGGRTHSCLFLQHLFLHIIPFKQLNIIHSRIGRKICFIYLSFGSTCAFTIMCNSHDVFPHKDRLGPRIASS